MIIKAFVRVLAFIVIAIGLTANHIQAEGNLKCLCDICDDNTCITDGFCYAYATWSLGNEEVIYSYRCIGRFALISGHPEGCQRIGNEFARECCGDADYCNRNFEPVLPLVRANSSSEVTSGASNLEKKLPSLIKLFIYVTVTLSWIACVWR